MPDLKPHTSFRQTLQFYLIDCQTPLGRLIDFVIIALNVAICLVTVIETYPISETARALLWKFEIVVVSFFILEYAARIYAAPSRWKQIRDIYSIIDLIAILPTLPLLVLPLFGIDLDLGFIQMIRGFRIFRIFRFLRFTADPDFFFGRITRQLLKVVRLVFTIVMIFFISAGLFYEVEHEVNAKVQNFGDAFYFTVVALTTVGFGDITPQSQGGKWVTVLMIISGIILIPWQAARIVKEWIYLAQKVDVVCPRCGLRYHDKDASHCKSCGHVIYQEYEGDCSYKVVGTWPWWATMRNKVQYLQAWAFAFQLIFCGVLLAGMGPFITPFSAIDPAAGIPDTWKPLKFPNIPIQTDYRPVSIDGRVVIEAHSRGGASGLVHKLDVDPQDSPWLSWQWRIDRALEGADVTTKAGDDCAARIYIAFEFDGREKSWWERFKHGTKRVFAGQELPGSAIVYAWASGIDVGSIIDSPYTDQSKLIAVQSGNDLKGQWVSEKRNIVDDYLSAYGASPPAIIGIAIMTDTDNTGTETTAYYGDIRLERK